MLSSHQFQYNNHLSSVLKPAICRSLGNKIEVSHEARRRAASLPILQCHGISMYL
jgi:hypothetical protein